MAGIASLGLCPSLPPGLLAPSGARTYRTARTRGAVFTPGGGMAVPVDRRATVCIPARLVRQVSLQPGDQVSVFVRPEHIEVLGEGEGAIGESGVLSGAIEQLVFEGPTLRLNVDAGGTPLHVSVGGVERLTLLDQSTKQVKLQLRNPTIVHNR